VQSERLQKLNEISLLLRAETEASNPVVLRHDVHERRRVMPELMGMKHVLARNDEVHHCYREKPPDPAGEVLEKLKGDERKEAEKNNEAARRWISEALYIDTFGKRGVKEFTLQ
jgi:type III restriction enzyme